MQPRSFRAADRTPLVALWRLCGLLRPWNDPDADIDRKLALRDDLLLVLEDGGELIGSAMVGYDGHRGWVNYLGVHPDRRGEGHGRLLMHDAERRLFALGCPKINLQIRDDNEQALAFYARLGYRPDRVVSLGKRLIEDGRSLRDG